MINEVESFLKFKDKHPHSGSITVSSTVPGAKLPRIDLRKHGRFDVTINLS